MNDQNSEKPDGGGNGDQQPESGPPNNQPKPFRLIIDGVYSNQGIVVRHIDGFPDNYDTASVFMINFEKVAIIQIKSTIDRFFVLAAKNGELDENLTIIKKRIITPDGIKVPELVPPRGITKH